MGLNNALDDGQSQAIAPSFGGKKRLAELS
jgi:hypothetical protein